MDACTIIPLNDRLQQLSQMGDPLEALNTTIPWETFRPVLMKVHDKVRKSKAGRPAFDVIFMFKLLILKTLYNLSDDQLEYQVRDRLSFMRFLGLTLTDVVPDAITVWRFRERLKTLELLTPLFNRFEDLLTREGLDANGGQIIDASIVPAPIQRNSRKENAEIKAGQIPVTWTPRQRAQKDPDARWVKKHGKSFYGYKNHVSIDVQHRFVRTFVVTSAAPHDSQLFEKSSGS